MQSIVMYGCGHMGFPVAKAVLSRNPALKETFVVVESDDAKLPGLRDALGCRVVSALKPRPGDWLILAVKPVDTKPLAETIGKIGPDGVVISVMAGVTTASLQDWFGTRQVVRTIPNTPCLVGEGITVCHASSEVAPANKKAVLDLLGALGTVIDADAEEFIDKGTGVSGSGPAYVFYLAEALRDAAVDMGFKPQDAWSLATETIAGAGSLLRHRREDPTALRLEVMTPKGTTAAAIDHMEQHAVGRAMRDAFKASWRRAASLGQAPDR